VPAIRGELRARRSCNSARSPTSLITASPWRGARRPDSMSSSHDPVHAARAPAAGAACSAPSARGLPRGAQSPAPGAQPLPPDKSASLRRGTGFSDRRGPAPLRPPRKPVNSSPRTAASSPPSAGPLLPASRRNGRGALPPCAGRCAWPGGVAGTPNPQPAWAPLCQPAGRRAPHPARHTGWAAAPSGLAAQPMQPADRLVHLRAVTGPLRGATVDDQP
jgi:hypothetical protein